MRKKSNGVYHLWFEFTSRLEVLKPHNPYKSKDVYHCRRRLAANVYNGCGLGPCFYCFAISYTKIKYIFNPEPKKDFKKRLDKDIEKYCRSGYPKYPVYICSSCDPFQPLEEICGHALYALRRLREAGFPIIVMTKNPSMLLQPEYLEVMDKSKTVIQVTIPFLDSRFEPRAPPPLKRIEAVSKLIELGFSVHVRVDPIVPAYGAVDGQSKGEIEQLIKKLSEVGVKEIISKCLHLTSVKKLHSEPHQRFYDVLKPLYESDGFILSPSTMVLNIDVRKRLLQIVYETCLKHSITMSTCSDPAFFPRSSACDGVEETLRCL